MPVVVVPVAGVPESSAQPRKPLPVLRTPLTGLSHIIATLRRAAQHSCPGEARKWQIPRGEEDPQGYPASDASMKGEMRQTRTSPHTTQSQQRDLSTVPSAGALSSYLRRSAPEYGADGDLIGA